MLSFQEPPEPRPNLLSLPTELVEKILAMATSPPDSAPGSLIRNDASESFDQVYRVDQTGSFTKVRDKTGLAGALPRGKLDPGLLRIHPRLFPIVAKLLYSTLSLRTASIAEQVVELFKSSPRAAFYASHVRKIEVWMVSLKTYVPAGKRWRIDKADPETMISHSHEILQLCRPRDIGIFAGASGGTAGRPYQTLPAQGFWDLLVGRPGIQKLRLCGVEIDEAAFGALATMPDLAELAVWSCGRPASRSPISYRGFQKLRKLVVEFQMNSDEIRGLMEDLSGPHIKHLDLDVSSCRQLVDGEKDLLASLATMYPRLRSLHLRDGLGFRVFSSPYGIAGEKFNRVLQSFQGRELVSLEADCIAAIVGRDDDREVEVVKDMVQSLTSLCNLRDCLLTLWVQSGRSVLEQETDREAATQAKDRLLKAIADAGRDIQQKFRYSGNLHFKLLC